MAEVRDSERERKYSLGIDFVGCKSGAGIRNSIWYLLYEGWGTGNGPTTYNKIKDGFRRHIRKHYRNMPAIHECLVDGIETMPEILT